MSDISGTSVNSGGDSQLRWMPKAVTAPVEMVTNAIPRKVTRPRHARKPYRSVNDT